MDNISMITQQPERRTIAPPDKSTDVASERYFITANTVQGDLIDISNNHIIPVFIKDNEPLISHADFINCTSEVVKEFFECEDILCPIVRLSHPIKGRIPEAKDKPASELMDNEKTIYYERMAFVIEVASISDVVGGNPLNLVIGGVKSYNSDNFYGRKGSDEHFQVFVGFQNKVCTNLCVWTDGISQVLKVKSKGQLKACIRTMLENYNRGFHLHNLKEFCNHSITEQQFATLIGRCRMYNHLPQEVRTNIPALVFGDTQIGSICRDYYRDRSFCKDENGDINLWKLYNLFTGSNKSSYIDSFIERGASAFNLVYSLKQSLQHQTYNWYLS